MKKKQFWVLLPALLLILTAAIAVFQDTLVMYFFPQIPIGEALERTLAGLEEHIQDSPLPILLRGYEENGCNTIYAELSTEGSQIGSLQIETDLEGNQLQLRGAFPEGSKLPNLDLYMNQDFVALTSQSLLQGGYYGITYETFPQDLRSIPLVSLLVSEELKEEWEASVQDLQRMMNQSISLPAIPDISISQLKTALLGLWVLRPDVSTVTKKISGQPVPCYQVTYRVEGETAKFLWEKALQLRYTGNEEIRLTFYLHQKSLVQLELNARAGDQHADCLLAMEQDTLSLRIDKTEGTLSGTISQEGEWSNSTLRLNDAVYSYQWNSQTGDMVLNLPQKEPIALNLTEAENGFRVQSRELEDLTKNGLFADCDWDVTVTKGSDIVKPPYKNLDSWSMEDLLIFLNGIWSVFKENAF